MPTRSSHRESSFGTTRIPPRPPAPPLMHTHATHLLLPPPSLNDSLNIRNATSRVYDDASPPLELPAISLRFARPSDLSSMSDADTARGRVPDVRVALSLLESRAHVAQINKSGDSWQTTHVQSRTSPQV